MFDFLDDLFHEQIVKEAQKIENVIKEYDCESVIVAAFCINSWIMNRIGLTQALAINCAIYINDSFGTKTLSSYDDFKVFFDKINNCLADNYMNDPVPLDFGEVYVCCDKRNYPIIIGNGYNNNYAIVHFLIQLAKLKKLDKELVALLEYYELMIIKLRKNNKLNSILEKEFTVPTEDYWISVCELIRSSEFKQSFNKAKPIMYRFEQYPSQLYSKKYNEKCYPLFCTSILYDYFKHLYINLDDEKTKDKICEDAIEKLLNETYNFSNNSINRFIFKPILDTVEPKLYNPNANIDDSILFIAGNDKHCVVAVSEWAFSEHDDVDKFVEKIKQQHRNNTLYGMEQKYNKGIYGIEIKQECSIEFLKIHSYMLEDVLVLDDQESDFREVGIVDLFNIIAFSDNKNEFVDFFVNEKQDNSFKFSLGLSNYFFAWKNANHILNQGAVDYDNIFVSTDYSDQYIFGVFNNAINMPFNKGGVFNCPTAWRIKDIKNLDYYDIGHKGCNGFFGKVCNFIGNSYCFIGTNLNLYQKNEISSESENIFDYVSDVLINTLKKYGDLIDEINVLQNKLISVMILPFSYVKNLRYNVFMYDNKRKFVFSDMLERNDEILIRCYIDQNKLFDELKLCHDRTVENIVFREILMPVSDKYPQQFTDFYYALDRDKNHNNSVGLYSVDISFLYDNDMPYVEIKDKDYVLARKTIAEICYRKKLEPGCYRGKEAVNIRNLILDEITLIFEKKLANYNLHEVLIKSLDCYACYIFNELLNKERYNILDSIDVSLQEKYRNKTVDIINESKKQIYNVQFLIESVLYLQGNNVNGEKNFKTTDYRQLLALANWICVIIDGADINNYRDDAEYIFEIDNDYRINSSTKDNLENEVLEYQKRKYTYKDYAISDAEFDKKAYKLVVDNLNKELNIDFSLMLMILQGMQAKWSSEIAKKISYNVYAIKKSDLIEYVCKDLPEWKEKREIIERTISFLELDIKKLKFTNKENNQIPVWERLNRVNRLEIKPLIALDNDIIYSPIALKSVLTKWQGGIVSWFLPFTLGLHNTKIALQSWKAHYEKKIEKDVAGLFSPFEFDIVETGFELYKRFPKFNFDQSIGDYDVFAVNKEKKLIFIIECKMIKKVGSIYEDQVLQNDFFFSKKYDDKFQRRIDYMNKNLVKIGEACKVDLQGYEVRPYMVTNKIFASRYKKLKFQILTFEEFKELLENL